MNVVMISKFTSIGKTEETRAIYGKAEIVCVKILNTVLRGYEWLKIHQLFRKMTPADITDPRMFVYELYSWWYNTGLESQLADFRRKIGFCCAWDQLDANRSWHFGGSLLFSMYLVFS